MVSANGHNPDKSLLDKIISANKAGMNQDKEARIAEIRSAIEKVFENQDMHMRANLTEYQMLCMIRLHMFAERYDSDFARMILKYGAEISISKNGRSRQDMISIANAVLATEVDGGGSNLVKRVLGRQ